MKKPVICFVIGTRPEAIKVAPVVNAMRADGRFEAVLIGSGQHTTPVLQALEPFGLAPDMMFDLDRPTGGLNEFSGLLTPELDRVFADLNPAACVVHGDTITASVAALAAFFRQIPVVHLEAGLRTGDLASPFPEEGNRKIIDHLCALHLAPTVGAAMHLIREGLPQQKIVITGNTVVDAIQDVCSRDLPYSDPRLAEIEESGKRIVLLTVHRRESWGEPLERILAGVRELIRREPDIHVVAATHPNPDVQKVVRAALGGVERVLVCPPLPYADMARLLANASLVLTDSGGIQEEAPTFDVPVLILRDVTERPEAVEYGVARLIGADPLAIVAEGQAVLAGVAEWNMTGYANNPFGDGQASQRSVAAIAWMLGLAEKPESFQPESAQQVLDRPLIYAVA
jgi:UDP-N-acetylglucosamine 2-epimerase (non-hydrolysing)